MRWQIFLKIKSGLLQPRVFWKNWQDIPLYLKGLAKSKITIRKVRIKYHHPHGFLRARKKRRV